MNTDCLKLTVYFGERDRAGGRFLADALSELYARHRVQTSLVMRGVEGFGVKHHLHTDRLLSLSEDLPLVSVAVDERRRIEALLPELDQLEFDGLVTLERARLISESSEPMTGPGDADEARVGAEEATVGPEDATVGPEEATKLTVYVGRYDRGGGRSAYEAVVNLFHRRGLGAANVLLGVDGTAHGLRRRAQFFASNSAVPLMVMGVGAGPSAVAVVPELRQLLSKPLVTLERVRVCKRDGRLLARPHDLPGTDETGMGIWQKLMVHAPERAQADGHPLHGQLIRSLRQAGAAGATTLRGIWGYSGGQQPHGDSFWQLRRRVPTLTVVVDTPERIRDWFEVIDALTESAGLVTSEVVPAYRATGPGIVRGGLRLARP